MLSSSARSAQRLRRVAGVVGSALGDLVVPRRCGACGVSTAGSGPGRAEGGPTADWCDECWADLVGADDPVCPRCATRRPAGGGPGTPDADCPVCRHERWAFDGAIALGPYEGLLRELLLEAKRPAGANAAIALGRLLAERHAERLSAAGSTAVVLPMPMHWRRRLVRRTNSAERLAEGIATTLGVPMRRWLRRRRATPPQTSVAPSGRAANVRGAFWAKPRPALADATVLLVDDVLTTGASASAAARALRTAGAGRVVAVVAARRLAPG